VTKCLCATQIMTSRPVCRHSRKFVARTVTHTRDRGKKMASKGHKYKIK